MKQAILILSVLMFASCAPNEVEKLPKDILDKDKFIEVIKDKALIEAALNVNPKNVVGKLDSVYNFNVYTENGITKAQYDSTVKYYSAKPGEFKEITEAALDKLNVEKAKR